MSMLHDAAVSGNVADEDSMVPAPVSTEAPTDDTPDTLLGSDPVAEAKELKNETGLAKLVKLAIGFLDNRDIQRRYLAFGKEALSHAKWQKVNFAAWTDDDFGTLCKRVEERIKFTVAVKKVDVGQYVRAYVWIEAVRPMVPNVDKLSWFQIVNKFLPTLSWSAKELEGEIKKGWLQFIKDTVTVQVSDSPLSIKELDKAIADHKALLEAERLGKKRPEQILEAERKAALAARSKAENEAREKITMGVDEALGGLLSMVQVMDIVEKIAEDRKVAMPFSEKALAKLATMTPNEAKMLVNAMHDARNSEAMIAMKKVLDVLVPAMQSQFAAMQAA